MLSKLLRYAPLILLLTSVWIILNERFDPLTVGLGILLSAVAILTTNRLVLKESYLGSYALRPLPATYYVLRLFAAIYIAGFQAVRKMFTGRIHVGIVDIETRLTNTFALVLLANSITLTPGTVTLDREGQRLKVIWLDCATHDPDIAGPAVKGPFEGLLERAVR